MIRKLQIFVSSTYLDLIEERQAAVEAILRAGHIPAGMELFAAGDKSQLETIYRWIDDSDIYMLILGARYGSIEKESGKSYSQLEYEYAAQAKKALFAVVLSERAIEAKLRSPLGAQAIERKHQRELDEFRDVVRSRICRDVHDAKDIKVAVHESILAFGRREFSGWIAAKGVKNSKELREEVARLSVENAKLRSDLQRASKRAKALEDAEGLAMTYAALEKEEIRLRKSEPSLFRSSIASLFFENRHAFATGIANRFGMTENDTLLIEHVVPRLVMHGLVEEAIVPGTRRRRVHLTPRGKVFALYLERRLEAEADEAPARENGAPELEAAENGAPESEEVSEATISEVPS